MTLARNLSTLGQAATIGGNIPTANLTGSISTSSLTGTYSSITFSDATSLTSAGTLSAANNGSTTLPNGLILKWGRGTASSPNSGTSTAVTFSTAFPTAAYSVWVQLENLASGGAVVGTSWALVTALSATAFTWQRGNNGNLDTAKDYFWFAIGT